MRITNDISYITGESRLNFKKGLEAVSVHSIHFDRYFSEEERKRNLQAAQNMTHSEYEEHCNELSKELSVVMEEIASAIAEKYDLHQYTEETSSMKHYKSDWDMFFYSNKGWNKKDWYDYFSLTFNSSRTSEQNLKLLEDVIEMVKEMDYPNVACRIQYTTVPCEEPGPITKQFSDFVKTLMSLEIALHTYNCENIDVVINEETNMLDIIWHSDNNSFSVKDSVANSNIVKTTMLIAELDRRGVGYCL